MSIWRRLLLIMYICRSSLKSNNLFRRSHARPAHTRPCCSSAAPSIPHPGPSLLLPSPSRNLTPSLRTCRVSWVGFNGMRIGITHSPRLRQFSPSSSSATRRRRRFLLSQSGAANLAPIPAPGSSAECQNLCVESIGSDETSARQIHGK